MDTALTLRPAAAGDAAALSRVIREVMTEYGAAGPGTSLHDPEVLDMPRAYAVERSCYFVVMEGSRVLGGAGVAPLASGDGATAELRKMYLLPDARGRGAGAALLEVCIAEARAFGFERMYLETLGHMTAAHRLYEAFGFVRGEQRLGDTGHHACHDFFVLALGVGA